ncbi:flagellar motor protein MotB [bacterium]|nr:flagellar motor protein MotB [bacterium]
MAEEGSDDQSIVIKKIKKAGHGHHGGAWKVAYADFVTAMMAFFLVMWIVGMSDADKKKVEEYFNDPLKYKFGAEKIFQGLFSGQAGEQFMNQEKKGGVVDSIKQGGVSRVHLLAQDIESWMTPFESDILDFKVTPDRIQFALTAESMFSPGSVLLKPEAEPLLRRMAEVLKPLDAHFMIEAHTDDLPVDNPSYPTNWELSAIRSATVVRYFIDAHYFDPAKLTAMSAGETKPVADNRTPAGRARNRRIDIYIIPQGKTHSKIRSALSH